MIAEIDNELKKDIINSIKSNTLAAFRYYVFTTYSFEEFFLEAAFIHYYTAVEYCNDVNDPKKYIIIDMQDEYKRID